MQVDQENLPPQKDEREASPYRKLSQDEQQCQDKSDEGLNLFITLNEEVKSNQDNFKEILENDSEVDEDEDIVSEHISSSDSSFKTRKPTAVKSLNNGPKAKNKLKQVIRKPKS